MAKTYIAFIECTFHDNPPWNERRELDDPENEKYPDPREQYIAKDNGARLSLVDLKGKRRDFTFKQHGVVEIIGNVVIIIDWQLEKPSTNEYQ